jgi:hypothetical protein
MPLKQMLINVKNIMDSIKENEIVIVSIDEAADEDIRESKKIKIDVELIEIENTPNEVIIESNIIENDQDDDCILLDDENDKNNENIRVNNYKLILEGNICKLNDKIECLNIISVENLSTNFDCKLISARTNEIKDKIDNIESYVDDNTLQQNNMEEDLQIKNISSNYEVFDPLEAKTNVREDEEDLKTNNIESNIQITFNENIQIVNDNIESCKQTNSTDLEINTEKLGANNDIQVLKEQSVDTIQNEISLNIEVPTENLSKRKISNIYL